MSFTDRFSDLATAYVAARPSYPVESVDVLIEGLGDPASLAVADLGAGTGISSRVIAARGRDGDVACYPLGENHHENGVLRREYQIVSR